MLFQLRRGTRFPPKKFYNIDFCSERENFLWSRLERKISDWYVEHLKETMEQIRAKQCVCLLSDYLMTWKVAKMMIKWGLAVFKWYKIELGKVEESVNCNLQVVSLNGKATFNWSFCLQIHIFYKFAIKLWNKFVTVGSLSYNFGSA